RAASSTGWPNRPWPISVRAAPAIYNSLTPHPPAAPASRSPRPSPAPPGDVVLALQFEPELRAVAEVAAEPHRRVGGDRAPRVENVGDAAGRHADVERQPDGGQLACGQFALEQASGMGESTFHGVSLSRLSSPGLSR